MAKKDYTEDIKSYKSKIVHYDFISAIRITPTQYIGYKGNRGVLSMIREVYQNSVDEILRHARGHSPCDRVQVTFNQDTLVCSVRDNGRGIPFEIIEQVFTDGNTSSNFSKQPGEFTSGRHGVGAKATNALSEFFIVTSHVLGKGKRVTFEKGFVTKVEDIKSTMADQGTEVEFRPDETVMGRITLKAEAVKQMIRYLLSTLPIGTVIEFTSIIDGQRISTKLENKDGLIDYLAAMTTKPLIPPIMLEGMDNTKEMAYQLAFTYSSEDIDQPEEIFSFANYCSTNNESSHVKGFLTAVTNYFRRYMNSVYLKNSKKKLQVINADIKMGMKAAVSVQHLHPDFSGQAKEIFGNLDMEAYLESSLPSQLEAWTKMHGKELKTLCDYFKDVATIRKNNQTNTKTVLKKYEKSSITGMPSDFIASTKKEMLIIMEGDSAAGGYRDVRDPATQAIFKLRGKIKNGFKLSNMQALLKSEVVAKLAKVVSDGHVCKNFTIEKCPWKVILFSTDADVDGAHIRTLLLKLMILLFPGLIESGRVCFVTPPLYSIKVNGKKKYFINEIDFIEYTQKKFIANHDIRYTNSGVIPPKDITRIIVNSLDYYNELGVIANNNALAPVVLESIVEVADQPFDKICKYLKKKYRFFLDSDSKSKMIKLLYNSKMQTIFLDDAFLNTIHSLYNVLHSTVSQFVIDGRKSSLYDLMDMYNSYVPDRQRYKGLGEMNPEELAESTLYPKKGRVYYRYQSDDYDRDIKNIRLLNDNTKLLLKDINDISIEELGD